MKPFRNRPGTGKVQVRIRRAYVVHGADATLSTRQLATDVQSLSAAWKATLKVNCPYCREVHEISVRETYIDAALFDVAHWQRHVIWGRT